MDELLGHGIYYGRVEARRRLRGSRGDRRRRRQFRRPGCRAPVEARCPGPMLVRGEKLAHSMSLHLVDRIEASQLASRFASAPMWSRSSQGRPVHSRRGRDATSARAAAGGDDVPLSRRRAAPAGPRMPGCPPTLSGYVLTGLDLLQRGQRPEDWPLDRDPWRSRRGLRAVHRGGRPPRIGEASRRRGRRGGDGDGPRRAAAARTGGRGLMATIEVEQADITKLDVDAIANAANTQLRHGGGVAAAISRCRRLRGSARERQASADRARRGGRHDRRRDAEPLGDPRGDDGVGRTDLGEESSAGPSPPPLPPPRSWARARWP